MNEIKIKFLTKEQLIISIDRLTRFKETEQKYLRVFGDILTSNLITPKYKRAELEAIGYKKIVEIAQYIINSSLDNLGYNQIPDYEINKKIAEYEKNVFKINSQVEILLNNKINYNAFLQLLPNDTVKNLLWLQELANNSESQKCLRYKNSLRFPIEKVIIAEGATEETLLPVFGKLCGYDFDKEGVYILSAGGKNQVVKLYYKLVEVLKLPIFVLLDKDAIENFEEIKPKLRDIDKVHVLDSGEFEDLLPFELVKRTLYYAINNLSIIEEDLLNDQEPRAKMLEEIFKKAGMHSFKKVEFANLVKNNIKSEEDISEEIVDIIEEIRNYKN